MIACNIIKNFSHMQGIKFIIRIEMFEKESCRFRETYDWR